MAKLAGTSSLQLQFFKAGRKVIGFTQKSPLWQEKFIASEKRPWGDPERVEIPVHHP